MQVVNGSADVTTYFVLRDVTTHAPKADVTVTDIDLYYVEDGAAISAKADATALAAADSAHADNKAFHVGKGLYRIDWPDEAFNGGVGKKVQLVVECTGVDTEFLEVLLSPPANVTQWNGEAVAAPNLSGVPVVDVGYVDGAGQGIATSSDTLLIRKQLGFVLGTILMPNYRWDPTTFLVNLTDPNGLGIGPFTDGSIYIRAHTLAGSTVIRMGVFDLATMVWVPDAEWSSATYYDFMTIAIAAPSDAYLAETRLVMTAQSDRFNNRPIEYVVSLPGLDATLSISGLVPLRDGTVLRQGNEEVAGFINSATGTDAFNTSLFNRVEWIQRFHRTGYVACFRWDPAQPVVIVCENDPADATITLFGVILGITHWNDEQYVPLGSWTAAEGWVADPGWAIQGATDFEALRFSVTAGLNPLVGGQVSFTGASTMWGPQTIFAELPSLEAGASVNSLFPTIDGGVARCSDSIESAQIVQSVSARRVVPLAAVVGALPTDADVQTAAEAAILAKLPAGETEIAAAGATAKNLDDVEGGATPAEVEELIRTTTAKSDLPTPGGVSYRTVNPALGKIHRIVWASGKVTEYQYDAAGRWIGNTIVSP